MEDFLSWGLVLKALAVWVGVYFLQPVMFLGRDHFVNWYIRRHILTDDLSRAIQMRANDVWLINNTAKDVQIRTSESGETYFIDGIKVDEATCTKYRKMMDSHLKREAECATLIRNRQFQVERVIRYFKQDMTNPIPEWEKRAYARVKTRRAKDLPNEAEDASEVRRSASFAMPPQRAAKAHSAWRPQRRKG